MDFIKEYKRLEQKVNYLFSTAGVSKTYVDAAIPYGGASVAGNATETAIVDIGVAVQLAGVFVVGFLKDMTTDATGKLTYIGTTTKHFHIVSNFDVTSPVNNQIVSFQWFKNGVAISVPVERKIAVGSDIGAMSVHADAVLVTNDFIELRVANLTSTANVVCKNVYYFSMGMIM